MSLEGALAVTRFGLGAKAGEIERASRAPDTWLLQQLRAKNAKSEALDALPRPHKVFQQAKAFRRERRRLTGNEKVAATKKYNKFVRRNLQMEIEARAVHAAETNAPFHERLTRFWCNHFSVSARNAKTRFFVGGYEREAIRPHITDSFYDLANAAIFHPAMLMYLDNESSIGPASQIGQRRSKGLNENLAREVLELHTITPAAGYTQKDVTEFAKALTGWTVEQQKRANKNIGKPLFDPRTHEPGTRIILGKEYLDRGKSQARNILKDICSHPETAKNIAYKLARHFVSDIPPEALVKHLTESFIKTNGSLKALYETLIQSPLAWTPEAKKVKTPEELFISTARAIGLENVFPKRARDSYDSLAQTPFGAPTPEGWPDTTEDWIGPDAIMKRIEWANELASRMPQVDARKFLQSALGPRVSNTTLEAVSRAESGQQALVLALMSPDFQRR